MTHIKPQTLSSAQGYKVRLNVHVHVRLCVGFSCPSLQFQADQPSAKQSSMMRVWSIFSGKMTGTTENILSLALG